MHRTDVDAVATARARSHERNFVRRTRRTEPTLGGDALLGPPREFVQQLADRALEELSALGQKLGSRLNSQRNATR